MATSVVQPVRFMALDMHKHQGMVGAVNQAQEVLLRPRKFTWPECDRWAQQHIGPGDVIVIEASGNAWHGDDPLSAGGAVVQGANPLLVKWIGSAPVKTDPHETLKLAKLLAAGMLPIVWGPPAAVWKAKFARYERRLAAGKALVASARQMLVSVWYLWHKRTVDRHSHALAIAQKLWTWAEQGGLAMRHGLSCAHGVRFQLDQLGIGQELTEVLRGRRRYRLPPTGSDTLLPAVG